MKFNCFDLQRRFGATLAIVLLLASAVFGQKETESVEKYRVVYPYQAPQFDPAISGAQVLRPRVSPDSVGVYYVFDQRLTNLLDLHRRMNSSTLEGKGFRIQIYAGSKMEVANEAKADFVQTFRDGGMEVYKDWVAPHFWVRVGDFLSRNEAMRHLPNVKAVFPDAFVVSDKINLPKYKKTTGHVVGEQHETPSEGQQD